MNADLKDEIARLRWEAKHHREQAAQLRKVARGCKDRRDWIGALEASSAAGDRTLAARQADQARAAIQVQLGGAR